MPIGFCRLEYVKRSSSKNACAKAAYNSRSQIAFKGTKFAEPKIYTWSFKQNPTHHEVLLPDHVDQKFQSPEYIWNRAEQKENRKNSQPAFEMVIALPDDAVVSVEDRIKLTREFVQKHVVNKGLAAQIDIHPPEKKMVINKNGKECVPKDHNWHAHVLVTTRRFKENGQELADHKARDLMPVVRNGKVISGENWGKLWTQFQNQYFEEKGLPLRVDQGGIVSQKHLGPVRMRGRAFDLLTQHEARVGLNQLESEDPLKILNKLVETRSCFTVEDVDRFLEKHVDSEKILSVRDAFWRLSLVIQLLDPQTQKPLNKFTTQTIIDEENKTLRLADRLIKNPAFSVNDKKMEKFTQGLNPEQKEAFDGIVHSSMLSCIEGYAGTGKSYLLNALRQGYESNKCTVRALGPDNATAIALNTVGFDSSENVYRFLFAVKNKQREIRNNREVWILDEAGKMGTASLQELLKYANKFGAQLILSGDSKQLPSVSRGGMFSVFSERYGAQNLQNIQRQHTESQREIAKKLAVGEVGAAIDSIVKEGGIKWCPSKESALESLITSWASNRFVDPNKSHLILAHSNKEVRALNELARLYRREAGEIASKEYACETSQGKIYVSCGDHIEFREKNEDVGILNGTQGVLVKASEKKFTVQIQEEDKKRNVTFNPQKYCKFQLGYATTYYRSQGSTVDHAYVLYSPQINKELFYVGFTRHVKRAELYISEGEARHLSEVKRASFRSSVKESTLKYTTQKELQNIENQSQKAQKLKSLKSSDSFVSKMKGYGLSTWLDVRSKVQSTVKSYQDASPSKDFFNPDLSRNVLGPGKVSEVKESDYKQFDGKVIDQTIFINKDKAQGRFKKIINQGQEKSAVLPQAKVQPSQRFSKLPIQHKSLVDKYFNAVNEASSLYTVVKAKQAEKGTEVFEDWQNACGKRNSIAHEVVSTLREKDSHKIFKGKSLEILNDRAAKHIAMNRKVQQPLVDYDQKLKDNLDALLARLFPEGPTARDKNGFRFGSKGSLKVTCSGSKCGSFFDFEEHQGGGPIQLIQKEMLFSKQEAFVWAKDFLNEAPNMDVPTQFHTKRFAPKRMEWTNMKPNGNCADPSFTQLSSKLASRYNEVDRYAYRDAEGNLLFYTLRLEEKGTPTKKIVIPLSFGYNPESDMPAKWSFKGYQSEYKPLYNLHLLNKFPDAQVLIVEGEKTADTAGKMFPNEKMIALSWSGGAGAASKADWERLKGRDVILWPDNDKAGFDAAEAISEALQKVGIKSLREVNKQLLAQELPPKWDLADPLPEGKTARFIKNTILRASQIELESVHERPTSGLKQLDRGLEL